MCCRNYIVKEINGKTYSENSKTTGDFEKSFNSRQLDEGVYLINQLTHKHTFIIRYEISKQEKKEISYFNISINPHGKTNPKNLICNPCQEGVQVMTEHNLVGYTFLQCNLQGGKGHWL